ncbi:MFS-type transporter SLC18B1-like [Branchiostoma floridae x Branchiostoma belcheri]
MEPDQDDSESARLLLDHGQNTSRHVQLGTHRVPDVVTYGTVTDRCPEVIPHNDTETATGENGFSCAKASKRQIVTFLCVAFLNFSGMACSSIITPFFPDELKPVFHVPGSAKRGLADYSGITRIGSRFMLISGVFVGGSCSFLFGLLEYMEGTTFIAFCFAIRIMEALGVSAHGTASTTILTHEFPNNVAKVMGTLEIFVGLGMMTGPPIGGVLYNVRNYDEQEGKKDVSLLDFLKIPSVILACEITVVGYVVINYLEPVIQPYLAKEFSVTPPQVGLLFLLLASVYAVCAPVWGWLADKKNVVRTMVALGLLVLSVGALLVGPSPLLTDYLNILPKKLWVNILGIVVIALSIGAVITPIFNVMLWGASDAGIETDFATYGLVSGAFGAFMGVGSFVGPTVSSALVEKFGLPWATTAFSGFILFSMFLLVTFTICENLCRR